MIFILICINIEAKQKKLAFMIQITLFSHTSFSVTMKRLTILAAALLIASSASAQDKEAV